jgi:hypothetical protein
MSFWRGSACRRPGAFLGNALWALYTQIYGLSAISVVIILFTLACLLLVYRRFAEGSRPLSAAQRWCVVLPLSALASWLTVASMVNISASLSYQGVEGGDSAPLGCGAAGHNTGSVEAFSIHCNPGASALHQPFKRNQAPFTNVASAEGDVRNERYGGAEVQVLEGTGRKPVPVRPA